MDNTTSIVPFPNDVRTAFQTYVQGISYINRERIEYSKWRQLHFYLNDPIIKAENPAESRLKHRALTEFQLINKRLYRNPNAIHKEPRYVVPESEAFNLITHEHLQLLHVGWDKVWAAIQQKYYGISRQDVRFILKLCKNCALNRPLATKAPLVPIIIERAWERVQINLINMQHKPLS